MSESALDIERIVREVLRELQAADAAPVAPSSRVELESPSSLTTEAARDTSADSARQAGTTGRVVLEERVVTLAQLDGRLAGVREVVVLPRAVVTPAVADELRRHSVSLVRAAAPARPTETAAGVRVELWNVSRSFDAAPLVEHLRSGGCTPVEHQADCLVRTTNALAVEVHTDAALGLILTRHAAVALCLANRHAGVRAVTAGDVPTLHAAVEAVGANVLVLDWSKLSGFALKQLAAAFCRQGVRACPEALRDVLG